MKRYYKTINDQVVFFQEPLIHDGMQTFNPSEEMILAAGWQEWQEPSPSEAELLQQAIENKLKQIAEYDASTAVNSFTINGQPLWLDAPLRQQLRISIDAFKATGAQTVTKWFNGIEYTFPTDQWITMLNLLEVYAANALNVTEAHKAAVMTLDSIEAIEEYDITEGYPQKIEFNNIIEEDENNED